MAKPGQRAKSGRSARRTKAAAKRAAARRPAPKKASARKAAAKKPLAKKATAKKAVAKKAAVKKPAAKKAPARKPAPKRPAPRSSAPVRLPVLPAIDGYVNSLPPPVKPIVAALRRIVKEAAPGAREVLLDESPAYEANGLFARIEAQDRAVLLHFFHGSQLLAPPGVLEAQLGDDRSVSVSSLDELKENVLRTLVRQAVLLNSGEWQSQAGVPDEA